MKKAHIFQETYSDYLFRLQGINIKDRAENLGAKIIGEELALPFFSHEYFISSEGIRREGEGQVPFALRVLLSRYVLMCPEKVDPCDAHLVNYRDFQDAAPLVSYFTTNTNKAIEIAHSGEVDKLYDKCKSIGGMAQDKSGYDLSMMFSALPRIPIYLNFNDADDEFPAKCIILYKSDAEKYLDMECLAITGTYLAGKLL